MNNYYIPTFEELKEGDIVQVMTSYGWVEMTYPDITETMFFRDVDEIGFEKAVRELINLKSIQKFRIDLPTKQEVYIPTSGHYDWIVKSHNDDIINYVEAKEGYFFTEEQLEEYKRAVIKQALHSKTQT